MRSPSGDHAALFTPQPETLQPGDGDTLFYVIPHLDIMLYNRLALIITRLDPDETDDLAGRYRLTLESP